MIAKLGKSILFGLIQAKKPGNRPHKKRVKESIPPQGIEKTAATPVFADEFPPTEIRKTMNGSVVTFEGTYLGKPIRVRIYNDAHQKSMTP